MNESNEFILSLKKNDKNMMSNINKVDLHNHASYSCSIEYLKGNGIKIVDEKVNNIESLIQFSRKYINPIKQTEEGLYLLLNGNFINCINTGVSFVSTDIDYKDCIRTFNSNVNKFIDFLSQFKYDNLKIEWIIEISRDSYKEEYKDIIFEMINSGFFAGIDLVSTENIVPNSIFIDFYKEANKLNLKTKVHTGEQLGADYIKQCILDFNPKEIQHGIRIIEDENVMKIAKERNILFNVCPTSNLILGYVSNIEKHPIKKMYEYGLKVTIATDDLLYFNSDINDEYLKLYKYKVLSAEDLNNIRKIGFNIEGVKK